MIPEIVEIVPGESHALDYKGAALIILPPMFKRFLSRENLYALLLCLIVIALLIMTADASPLWIYQGF